MIYKRNNVHRILFVLFSVLSHKHMKFEQLLTSIDTKYRLARSLARSEHNDEQMHFYLMALFLTVFL